MKEQAEKAFQEMLDISTDLDKAILFQGDEVIVSNFPDSLQANMVAKAKELAALGDQRGKDMGGSPLTQLVVETGTGSVFVVREASEGGMGVLATGKKDSRVGLVFYDMKTCIRDAQETEDMFASPAANVAAEEETATSTAAPLDESLAPDDDTQTGGMGV